MEKTTRIIERFHKLRYSIYIKIEYLETFEWPLSKEQRQTMQYFPQRTINKLSSILIKHDRIENKIKQKETRTYIKIQ